MKWTLRNVIIFFPIISLSFAIGAFLGLFVWEHIPNAVSPVAYVTVFGLVGAIIGTSVSLWWILSRR